MSSSFSPSSKDITVSIPLDEVAMPFQQQHLPLEKDITHSHNINHQDSNNNVNIDNDFWYYNIGCNVIPADSKNKETHVPWGKWQNDPISDDQYKEWKNKGAFNNGMAVIAGRLCREPYKNKHIVCIDCDNKKGIDEFLNYCFPEIKTVEELSKKTIVEQHLDSKDKAHVYLVVEKPLKNTGRINDTLKKEENCPIIEIKSEGKSIVICSPSIHKDGHRYEIIGTTTPAILNREQSDKLEESLNQLNKKYNPSNKYNPSTGNFSYLTDELKNMTKNLMIDDENYKISDGTRNNTLLAVANSLLSNHFNSKDIENLKSFFFKVNQTLCEKPLDQRELESLWTQATSFIKNNTHEKHSSKNNGSSKSKREYTQTNEETKNKKEYTVFKYSSNNYIYESAIITGKPFFITFDKEGLKIIDKIEQETRVIKPPYLEEYPSKPYIFENREELEQFVNMIKGKGVSTDSLFWKIKEFGSKFIVHQPQILDYFSALILFSYHQDKFATVPYTMFVSDGGSGKSTVGNVFEDLGYRCVNMTDPTTANIFRIFGTIEAGQCTLVLDEAEKIDQDRDMMSILKNGYENGKRVQRVNQFGKQEHFHTFGLKMLSAERAPNPSSAKGVIDRTFIISNYKGKPQLDIKEIRKPKTIEQEKIAKGIEFLRKALFIYRLVHFDDEIADIETGLEGRDKELCKPILQLFYNTRSQQRIEKIFEILLDEKNDRKANSLERDVLEVLVSLFDRYQNGLIPFHDIWSQLEDKTNGTINEHNKHELETEIYGTIYKNTLSKTLRDRFGAKDPKTRDSKTRYLVFDIEKVKDHLKNYVKESPTKISCYQKISDGSDSSDSNRKDLFDDFFSFEPSLEINKAEIDKDITGGNLVEQENFHYIDKETNSKGLSNAVITVTAVTNENISEKKTESNQENGYKKQEQNTTSIEFIERDIAGSSKYSYYGYTLEQIEKFFDSNFAQGEEHTLEDSICRLLIGQRNYKPFFYYCKEHPDIKNIYLRSIEDHIRLKDPQRHKATLLELIQKKEE
ncbi:MAG: bifunctional DNA primase/polymerase [Candidatus Nitrosocosmicus sp.]